MNNADRAQKALGQIAGYGTPNDHLSRAEVDSLDEADKELVDQWARDLLCDLRHLCDVTSMDFEEWSSRSYNCYHDECIEEAEQARLHPTTVQIHEALAVAGLDVETWNTGGGCMVANVAIKREGSVVTYGGAPSPSGKQHMTEYIGVTHEDEWVICWYGEHDGEGVEHEIPTTLPAGDLVAMVQLVSHMVAVLPYIKAETFWSAV